MVFLWYVEEPTHGPNGLGAYSTRCEQMTLPGNIWVLRSETVQRQVWGWKRLSPFNEDTTHPVRKDSFLEYKLQRLEGEATKNGMLWRVWLNWILIGKTLLAFWTQSSVPQAPISMSEEYTFSTSSSGIRMSTHPPLIPQNWHQTWCFLPGAL